MEIDITLMFVTSILAIIGGIVTVSVAKMRSNSPEILKSRVAEYKELVETHKKEANHWRGKFNQGKSDLQIEGNYNLDDESAIVSLTKSIAPAILELLPKDVQQHAKGFLNNPELIDVAWKIYKDNPDQIKGVLSGFLKKASAIASGKTSESNTSEASQYGA